MAKVNKIYAREILDSRATPTIEVVLVLDDGGVGVASVPSGASTGTYEAHELRDGDMDWHLGKGVLKAVSNVNQTIFASNLWTRICNSGRPRQKLIALDGTPTNPSLEPMPYLGSQLLLPKPQLPLKNYHFTDIWPKKRAILSLCLCQPLLLI